MPTRVLHISDIHTGTAVESRLDEVLPPIVEELDPELVLFTGDLTHRGRRDQHERAAALLRSFERPLVVIPGNHDIPGWWVGRFTRHVARVRPEWPEREPVYSSPGLMVVGLNSVRPYRHQSGSIGEEQLERVRASWRRPPDGALKSWRSTTTCSARRGARGSRRFAPHTDARSVRRLPARSSSSPATSTSPQWPSAASSRWCTAASGARSS